MEKKQIDIITLIFLAISLLFSLYYIVSNKNNAVGVAIFILIFVAIVCIYRLLSVVIIKYKPRIEVIVLSLILIVGTIFTFIVPPFRVTDENVHYYRAYSITEGNLVAPPEGDEVTKAIIPFIDRVGDFTSEFTISNYRNSISNIIDSGNIKIVDETINIPNGAASYSFINYIPHLIALMICKLFKTSILFSIYLGRILNVITFAIVGYYSVKNIPFAKLSFSVLMLNPMLLHQVAGFSSDGITMSLVLFSISLILKIKYQEEEMNMKQHSFLATGVALLGLCKPPYVLICILVVMIYSKLGKNKTLKIIGYIIGPFILMLIWIKLSGFSTGEGITNYSIFYIIQNPLKYIYIIVYNIINGMVDYIYTGLVGVFGGGLSIANYFVITPLFLLIVSILENKENKYENTIGQQLILGIISIAIICGILTVGMLWNPIGSIHINGVQGRYFLPVVPLVIILLANNQITNRWKYFNECVFLIQSGLCLLMIYPVVEGYFLR